MLKNNLRGQGIKKHSKVNETCLKLYDKWN